MPTDRKMEDLPADDLEALTTAQADWDGVADEQSKAAPKENEEVLEDVLGVEAEDEEDVIGEDDDNPVRFLVHALSTKAAGSDCRRSA